MTEVRAHEAREREARGGERGCDRHQALGSEQQVEADGAQRVRDDLVGDPCDERRRKRKQESGGVQRARVEAAQQRSAGPAPRIPQWEVTVGEQVSGQDAEGIVLRHRVAGEQWLTDDRRDDEEHNRQAAEQRDREPVVSCQPARPELLF